MNTDNHDGCSWANQARTDCRICEVDGCVRPTKQHGRRCVAHRGNKARTDQGRAAIHARRHTPAWLRIVRKIERVPIPDGCWIWVGHTDKAGYGRLNLRRKPSVLAHRVSYEAFVGNIPVGLTLDHLCRNTACVNPEHLEPVTLAENVRRAMPYQPVATHCKRGHELTPENTALHGRIRQERRCRKCISISRSARGQLASAS